MKNFTRGIDPKDAMGTGDENVKKEKEKTRGHLEWIYLRLIYKHGENKNYDYMIKFKDIIDKI